MRARVVIRTPAAIVAEYDLDEVDEQASESELLAAATAGEPTRQDTEIVGQPYVVADCGDPLAEQGRRLQRAGDQLHKERRAAARLALAELESGTRKLTIATKLGITRATLNAWLSEAGRPPKPRKSSDTRKPQQ